MKRKTKIILCISAVAVLMLAIAFFNSDIWQFIRYNYSYNYVPPLIEEVLVAHVGVEEGELLSEEELRAFWAEFDGKFEGYYDSMPESVRKLTQHFIERVNTRYESNISVSQVGAHIPDMAYPEWIVFSFSFQDLQFRYEYREGYLTEKSVRCLVPQEMQYVNIKHEADLNGSCVLYSNNVTAYYRPETVSLYKTTVEHINSSVAMVIEIPTANYDEYLRDRVYIKNLSLKRIEDYIASKRKNSQ